MNNYLKWLSVAVLLVTLSSCSNISYYQQAISGHLNLMSQRQPIKKHLANTATPEHLRKQLQKVIALRNFAEHTLALPGKGQYTSYVDLKRRYVVWNVFASPELSLKSKTWCYLMIGCASYRGYYSQQDADRYANKLQAKGMDVYVAGIIAYSTLGWFRDPVLNTFIYRSDTQLANLIFHELAHQLLYVKNDSVFNESFATVIAREGLKRWMANQNNMADYEEFLQYQRREKIFVDLVLGHREQLTRLYQANISDGQKRVKKTQLIQLLRTDHERLKIQWGGQSNYDQWFAQDINNAQLNTIATYHRLVPALETLFAHSQYDLKEFYKTCRQLAETSITERTNYLLNLQLDPQ